MASPTTVMVMTFSSQTERQIAAGSNLWVAGSTMVPPLWKQM